MLCNIFIFVSSHSKRDFHPETLKPKNMKNTRTLIRFVAIILLALPVALSAQNKQEVKKVVVINGDSVLTYVSQGANVDTSFVYHFDVNTEDFEEAMAKLAVKLEEISQDLDIDISTEHTDNISMDVKSEGSSIVIRHKVDGETEMITVNLDSVLNLVDESVTSMKHSSMEEISNNSNKHQLKVVHAGMAFAIVKAVNTAGKELKISVLDEKSNMVIQKSIMDSDDAIVEKINLKKLKHGTYFVVVKMEQESVRYKLHIK